MKWVVLVVTVFLCCGPCSARFAVPCEMGFLRPCDTPTDPEALAIDYTAEAPTIIEPMNASVTTPPVPGNGGLLQGLVSTLGVIVVSELGDKTFFIALILALSHPPWLIFLGAMAALTLMSILSACLGLVSSYIPAEYVHYASVILFVLFGLKMLKEAYEMSNSAAREEYEEVQKTIDSRHAKSDKEDVDVEAGGVRRSVRLAWVGLEAFVMTFLAEWGDRSQITTVLLAAKENAIGVTLGAVLGHGACTMLAVIGGRFVADKISLRAVTLCGGLMFLAFAAYALYAGPEQPDVPVT